MKISCKVSVDIQFPTKMFNFCNEIIFYLLEKNALKFTYNIVISKLRVNIVICRKLKFYVLYVKLLVFI